ncbi:hypothetical protein ONR57_22885 [Hoyosella sp. YIM 151337]|uniref:hypothetical protein n=1 Tax=Hoyosella sp. YIM 151337 TaxID=2992742 RepID=UPI0022358C64|nr:hypothetical protein [Hoyosella sp. YIM 151337]MCW4356156.1 hypothetical protein [Hoyosella sp. YIM 151337]
MVVTTGLRRITGIVLLTMALLLGSAAAALAQDTEEAPEGGQSGPEALAGLVTCIPSVNMGLSTLSNGLEQLGVENTIGSNCLESVGTAGSRALEGAGEVAKRAAGGAFEDMALSFGEAGAMFLEWGIGLWIHVPEMEEQTFRNVLSEIADYTYKVQLACLALSLIVLGGRLALARSGALRDVGEEGFKQMVRATLAAGVTTAVITAAMRMTDGLARWFIEGTVGSDPKALVEAMVNIALYPGGTAILFVIGFIGILGGIAMLLVMIFRSGVLVLAAAALPIAGAAGGTRVGSQAFDKLIAWIIAFLLIKPVGAFVIGVAALLFMRSAPSNEDAGGPFTAVVGAILLASVALVLPALMRLIVPALSALGGGGSGLAAAAGVVAAGAAVGKLAATKGGSAAMAAGRGAGGGLGGGKGGPGGGGAPSPPPGSSGGGGGGAPAGFGRGSGSWSGSLAGGGPRPGASPSGGRDGGSRVRGNAAAPPGAAQTQSGRGQRSQPVSRAYAATGARMPRPNTGGFRR